VCSLGLEVVSKNTCFRAGGQTRRSDSHMTRSKISRCSLCWHKILVSLFKKKMWKGRAEIK
jgi:hypothetical protein